MANSNFVVHNGLTVGPLTIDAATGAITTTGAIATTGANPRISQNASNVIVTESFVNVSVNGANVASFSSTGLTVLGTTTTINSTTLEISDLNITVAKNAANGAAADGAGLTVAGASATITYTNATDTWNLNKGLVGTTLNVAGNVLATGGVLNSLTVNGATTQAGTLTVSSGFINSAGNVLATGGVLNSLTVNGTATATSGITVPSITKSGSNGVGDIGQTGNRFATIYGLATSAQYADLAEKYLADAEYSPGTVIHFGGEKEVSICDVDMCTRVAGVVSTNPAYIMNDTLEGEFVATVALTGRVPTKVRGPVRKGDLMVSAGEGFARAENLPQVGTVIGKALEDFNGDTGVIEVVVGKH